MTEGRISHAAGFLKASMGDKAIPFPLLLPALETTVFLALCLPSLPPPLYASEQFLIRGLRLVLKLLAAPWSCYWASLQILCAPWTAT
jgi:hypothetical protein